jgi:NAD+ synthase (glutamine-hydrolysing)
VIGKYEINDFILYHFLVNGDDFSRIVYLLNKAFDLGEKDARDYVNNFNNRFFSQQFKRLSLPEGVKAMEVSLSPRGEIKLNGDLYPPKLKQ